MHYFFLKRNIYFKFEYFLIIIKSSQTSQIKFQAWLKSLTWCQDKIQTWFLKFDLIFSNQILDTFQVFDLTRSIYLYQICWKYNFRKCVRQMLQLKFNCMNRLIEINVLTFAHFLCIHLHVFYKKKRDFKTMNDNHS